MKIKYIFSIFALLHAASFSVLADGGISGNYTGSISGTPATLSIKQNGSSIQGQIDASGYIYKLSGSAAGQSASGTLSDPQTGGAMKFDASLSGRTLNLTAVMNNIFTGEAAQLQMVFFAKR